MRSDQDISLESSELDRLSATLRDRQSALQDAEVAFEQVPTLLALPKKAKKGKQEALEERYKADAQKIHDGLADAKHNLSRCRQDVIESLRQISARHESARWFLEQVQQTSPYPSVLVADQILQLLQTLRSSDAIAGAVQSDHQPETTHSIPEDRFSDDGRREMARLLAEALDAPNYNLTRMRMEMKVAEATLNRLLDAKSVKLSTWRKARRLLKGLRTEPKA